MHFFTLYGSTLEEIQKEIQNYYDRWHPAGYGTFIKDPVQVREDLWKADGHRCTSCD